MQLKTTIQTIIKRVLSNLLDLLIFLLTYFLSYFFSDLEQNESNMIFILILSFVLCFIFPIFVVENTFGKFILKVQWEKKPTLKLFLVFKYSFYFLIFLPTFSFSGIIMDFPFFQTNNNHSLLTTQLFFAFIIIDTLTYICSLGKYHLFDYFLNLQIRSLNFRKSELKTVFLIEFFIGLTFIFNVACYRFNISFEQFESSFAKNIYNENFPQDKFYGNKVCVIKQKSKEVFLPNDVTSFLYEKEYDQKCIYLNIPLERFKSIYDRKTICYELINQSVLNDMFYLYKPKQTKIVLSSFQEGKFFNFKMLYCIYYYNHDLPEWGVHGGLKADSVTTQEYIKLASGILEDRINLNRIRLANVKSKSDKGKDSNDFYFSIKSKVYSNKFIIGHKKDQITLNKIEFKDVSTNEYWQSNFPVQSPKIRITTFNFLGDAIFEYEDNLESLIFVRKEISNKYL